MRYIARVSSASGRALYQSEAFASRWEAARVALNQRPNAKGAATCRAALIDGRWRETHCDIRWHTRHAIERGDAS